MPKMILKADKSIVTGAIFFLSLASSPSPSVAENIAPMFKTLAQFIMSSPATSEVAHKINSSDMLCVFSKPQKLLTDQALTNLQEGFKHSKITQECEDLIFCDYRESEMCKVEIGIMKPGPDEPFSPNQYGTPFPKNSEEIPKVHTMLVGVNTDGLMNYTFRLIMGEMNNRWSVLYYVQGQ